MGATFTLNAETLLHSAALPRMPCDKHHILVACFPKSGSTWLSEILSRLPDYTRVHLVPAYDRREQELAFERLILFHAFNYVAQHHCRYSHATEKYLETFSVKPIILIRNIFDCVVSIKDFMDGADKDLERMAGPIAYVPGDYFRWSHREKCDFIIDMIIPWYFNFFVGWRDFAGGHWVTYERLLAEPALTIKTASDKLGLEVSESDIGAALSAASQQPTKRNVAQAGRGGMLSNSQKDKIHTFASYYPSQDFSMIGL